MTAWQWIGAGASALALAACATTAASPDAATPAAGNAGVERIERGNLVIEGIPEIPAAVSERLRTYQNVRGHGFQDWTGDSVLISTRFAETSQIHRVDRPLGARNQLTFYDEPVGGADVSPAGDGFVFAKDTGGDEFYQGYLYDLTDGSVTRFTEPGTRNGGLSWSDDGTQAVWYRALDGDPDWDIMVGDPADPASVRVAHEGEGALLPVDWSPDGRRIAVQKYISITKSEIYVLNLQDGRFTEVNPDDDVAYSGAALLSGGDILTATDKGSEFRNLVRIDAATGEMVSFTNDIDWDVSSWALSPDERTVAFTVNEGGLGTIRLLDLASGTVRPGPRLPVGIASGLTWSPDSRRIGFTFNSPTSPSDAWSFDVRTLALTRWTEAEVGGLNPEAFAEPELIAYPNPDGMDIPAFVYRPAGEGPFPVIVSIHGGPEAQARPYFSSTIQYWVNELGAAVVVPNVRGSSGYGKTYVSLDNGLNRKESVEDIGALLDWIEGQGDLDSGRVVVYGGSYGGYMVLASMIDYADQLAGGVNIVGISDFRTFLENTKGYRRDLRRAEYGDERDPEIAAFFEEISPLGNADQITKPLFIIQGANDPRVPASEAEQILAAVRENGGEAWYLLALDEGHGFRKKSNRDYQREAETLFLEKVLAID